MSSQFDHERNVLQNISFETAEIYPIHTDHRTNK